jgi:hypothetical protein
VDVLYVVQDNLTLMNRLLTVIIAAWIIAPVCAEEGPKRNDGKKFAISMQMQPLGHGLWASGSFQSQDSGWSEHRCYIGYRQAIEAGKFKIVPIIHLPTLTNDSYKITIEGKQLIVSKRLKEEEVIRIELEHLNVPKVPDSDPFADDNKADIKIHTKFVEITSGTEELSFDWITTPFSGKKEAQQDAP